MPAPQMPGLASGIDTKDVVRKLVEVERAPIVRLENNRKDLNETIKALTELRKRTKTLQDALHAMSSFEAAFEQKRLNATPAGIVDGTVRKNAPPSKHTLQVLQLASNLSIASAATESKKRLPAAKIRIAGIESEFGGGTLQSLKEHLARYHGKHLTAKIVQVKENESILILDTIAQGEEALLKMEDPDGLLRSIGLLGVAGTPGVAVKEESEKKDSAEGPAKPAETIEKERWVLHPQQLETVKGANPHTSDDRKILELAENSVGRFRFLAGQNSQNRRLQSLSLSAMPRVEAAEVDDAPDQLTDGIKENINIKGVELETYNITRTRIKDPQRSSDYGVVLRFADREQTISLKGKAGVQTIPVEAGLTAVDFFADGEDVLFEALELTYAVAPQPTIDHSKAEKDKIPQEAEQRRMFPHLLRPAQNAKLKIDGIDISRKSNSGLNDIIEGVTLNLLKTSPENVETEILNDNDAAKKQVLSFVKAYNDLLQFSEDVGRTARITEAGKYREMRAESGILATNATIRQLINGLKMHTSSAYPANREPFIRTLAQIGISSGAIGGKREEVTKGFLEVDEAKLNQMLAENPAAVKELFAIDTNGDLRIDNGYAYVTENFLEPFTRFTRGLITEQIKSNQERVKQIDRDIKRQEEHVKSYEAKLKTKFGYMESSVQKSKATGTFLKQKLGNNSDNR